MLPLSLALWTWPGCFKFRRLSFHIQTTRTNSSISFKEHLFWRHLNFLQSFPNLFVIVCSPPKKETFGECISKQHLNNMQCKIVLFIEFVNIWSMYSIISKTLFYFQNDFFFFIRRIVHTNFISYLSMYLFIHIDILHTCTYTYIILYTYICTSIHIFIQTYMCKWFVIVSDLKSRILKKQNHVYWNRSRWVFFL